MLMVKRIGGKSNKALRPKDILFTRKILTLLMYVKKGPNKTSLATASKTRLPPIMLFKLALNVANKTPMATIGDQMLILLI